MPEANYSIKAVAHPKGPKEKVFLKSPRQVM